MPINDKEVEKAIRLAKNVATSLSQREQGGFYRGGTIGSRIKRGTGGTTVIGGPNKLRPNISETDNPFRLRVSAPGPGGVNGINLPRSVLEGGNGKGGTHIPGMFEVNRSRENVYGSDYRPPLNIGQIEKIHKQVLSSHFSKPIQQQILLENEALSRLRDAQHIGKTSDTLDEGEKLDTVRHEFDDSGRSYIAYGSKGTAGHALYSTGPAGNEKFFTLNTCPGQTSGCGGGIDINGTVNTRNGMCFAPKAEAQYPGAATRRAFHAQAKHDPAMTSDWILAHVGSLRNAAKRADKTNNVVLFRPNIVDETDRSTRHVLRGLNMQRKEQNLPPIIANSYGKTNELHDPENGYFVTHSNIGPKVKFGNQISENIGRDRQRIRSTINASDASGKDFVNEQGNLTPPKNSYAVSDVPRDSQLDAALQSVITHAKYWSSGRELGDLSQQEILEGPEGHFDGDGNLTTPNMAHYGHITLNGRRYDYQKQHVLHPRLVKVGYNKDGSDHIIPTDSRFKDDDYLPENRFMTKNGKKAGAILLTTPTKSTSGIERQASFTHHLDESNIQHALQHNGEWEVDSPYEQEAALGKEYVPPKSNDQFSSGGYVNNEDNYSTAFPSQNFSVMRHLAHRKDA